jgi:amino acid adenylation domain-containing protein/thioester reductase-like protein
MWTQPVKPSEPEDRDHIAASLASARARGRTNLSAGQLRLWTLLQIDPQSPDNAFGAFRLRGRLDVPTLQQSLSHVERDQELLRSVFKNVNGRPLRVTRGVSDTPFAVVTVPAGGSGQDALRAAVEAELQRGFDIADGPLARVTLVETSGDEYLMLLNMSRLIADERSVDLVAAQILDAYEGFRGAGRRRPSPASGAFATQVAREQRWTDSAEYARHLEYWRGVRDRMAGQELATDHARPRVKTHACAFTSRELAASAVASLRELASRYAVGPQVAALAAAAATLGRYSGDSAVTLGVGVSLRDDATADVVGPLENPVALSLDVDADLSFAQLLRGAGDAWRPAVLHGRVPFSHVVQQINPKRNLSHTPLFQASFEYRDQTRPIHSGAELNVERIGLPAGYSDVDLTVCAILKPDGFELRVDYNRDLYEADTMSSVVECAALMLEQGAGHPDIPVDRLDVVPRGQISAARGPRELSDPAQERCLNELVERSVEAHGDAVACVCGNEVVTYGELNLRANQLAHYLHTLGVTAETRVGICLERSVDIVVAIVAVLKAGSTYVPLDPAYPQDRLSYMLRDSKARVTITLGDSLKTDPDVARIDLEAEYAAIRRCPTDNPARPVSPDALAYLIYTSGSTGNPKAVMCSHRAVVNNLAWRQRTWGLTPDDRVLVTQSFSFDPSLWETFWPLLAGARMIITETTRHFDGAARAELIARSGITILGGSPSELTLLSEQPRFRECTSIRMIFSGGEKLPASLVERLSQQLSAAVINVYGPTEATIDVTYWRCRASDDPGTTPIGYPMANTQIHLLDREMRPIFPGFPGEIYVGGAGLARGYFGRPALTAERFLPDPFADAPGGRLYRSGDIGRQRADGSIVFVSRADHQVKVRGYRVELGEIERLLDTHPGILESAVVLTENEAVGSRLVAYVVAAPGADPRPVDLGEFLARVLPAYMIPAIYIRLEKLPRTANGKLSRKDLPAPTLEQIVLDGEYVGPRTPLEEAVQEEFQTALALRPVSIHGDFFQLGGTSFMLAKLAPRLAERFGIALPVYELFEKATVAAVAGIIEVARQQGIAALTGQLHVEQLRQDAALHVEINRSLAEADYHNPRKVLLTGATGYLGAYLLQALLERTDADVCCLVRAAGSEQAFARLVETMRRYEIWQPEYARRIVALAGDLGEPRLGLDEATWADLCASLDAVYHNGALVNFVYPYSKLRAPNVGGTREIVRLASTVTLKAVHYVSTVDVLLSIDARRPLLEEPARPRTVDDTPSGYTGSKWAAEHVMNNARLSRLPVTIHRPAQIFGHTQTGAAQPTDFLAIFVRGYLTMGVMPDFDRVVDHVPVDYLANAIVHISLRDGAIDRFYHHFNPRPVDAYTVYDWIAAYGYKFKILPYKEAQKLSVHISPSHPMYRVLPLMMMELGAPRAPIDSAFLHETDYPRECRNTLAMLEGSGIVCPPMCEKHIHDAIRYLIRLGWLETPDELIEAHRLRGVSGVPGDPLYAVETRLGA